MQNSFRTVLSQSCGKNYCNQPGHCTYLFGTGISGCIFYFKSKGYLKTILLVIVILPLVAGVMVQTLGLYGILTSYGPVNNFLLTLGIIDEPIEFLGTETGVIIGLTQGFYHI